MNTLTDKLTFFFSITECPKHPIPAFVIGNGLSRRNLNIYDLRGRGLVLGCNRFYTQYDFTGFPFFLGMCDQETMRTAVRNYRGISIIPFTKQSEIAQRGIMLKRVFTLRDNNITWPSTGHGMMMVALRLKCSPIILIGMGDNFEEIGDGKISDNMYPSQYSTSFKGYRVYDKEDMVYANNVNHGVWAKATYDIYKKSPQTFLRLEGSGNNIKQIPSITWEKIMQDFPVRYVVKMADIQGQTWPCDYEKI